jgi:V8-like Glu-specific endopeptidase
MKHTLFLLFLMSFISCNKFIDPEPPEVLFDKYKSSVVLIANQYYYEVNIDGIICYYSPASEQKIFLYEKDVLQNLSSSTGTGFIISENGEIITNNHVVNPKDENYIDEFSKFSEIKKIILIDNINSVNEEITNLEDAYYNSPSSEDPAQEHAIFSNEHYLLTSKRDILLNGYQIFYNANIYNSTSKLVIYKLGIAYNDTEITDFGDLQECKVVRLSDIEIVDLALIQTLNKTFNTYPTNIFNFDDNNPNIASNPKEYAERDITNPVKINDDVFMIGYNRGFSLAKTQLGIKSQFTSGKISQECDGERILYTIPALGGSSGSPVVDKWGNLIGVNFASLTGSQSFNFAIPVYELLRFYKGYPVLSDLIPE